MGLIQSTMFIVQVGGGYGS